MQSANRVLILGATSAMAQAVGRIYAGRGASLVLVGRNQQKLATVEADLKTRGAAAVSCWAADLTDAKRHAELVRDATAKLGGLDLVLIAHGTLPDQKECEQSYTATLKAIDENFLSTVSLLTVLAGQMEIQGHGTIAVISSVAGDRGRQSNYVYGAAKGGLNVFLQGLRNRLTPKGVHVLTIKPGFVDTPMTAHLKKGPLFASAEVVATAIAKAIDRRVNVAYVPWFWWGIMAIIKAIPENIFKRLRL